MSEISGFIAISEYVKNKHAQLGVPKDKIVVLYHFCEDKPQIISRNNGEKYIVYMGRLSEEKGIVTLLKAMKDSLRHRPRDEWKYFTKKFGGKRWFLRYYLPYLKLYISAVLTSFQR